MSERHQRQGSEEQPQGVRQDTVQSSGHSSLHHQGQLDHPGSHSKSRQHQDTFGCGHATSDQQWGTKKTRTPTEASHQTKQNTQKRLPGGKVQTTEWPTGTQDQKPAAQGIDKPRRQRAQLWSLGCAWQLEVPQLWNCPTRRWDIPGWCHERSDPRKLANERQPIAPGLGPPSGQDQLRPTWGPRAMSLVESLRWARQPQWDEGDGLLETLVNPDESQLHVNPKESQCHKSLSQKVWIQKTHSYGKDSDIQWPVNPTSEVQLGLRCYGPAAWCWHWGNAWQTLDVLPGTTQVAAAQHGERTRAQAKRAWLRMETVSPKTAAACTIRGWQVWEWPTNGLYGWPKRKKASKWLRNKRICTHCKRFEWFAEPFCWSQHWGHIPKPHSSTARDVQHSKLPGGTRLGHQVPLAWHLQLKMAGMKIRKREQQAEDGCYVHGQWCQANLSDQWLWESLDANLHRLGQTSGWHQLRRSHAYPRRSVHEYQPPFQHMHQSHSRHRHGSNVGVGATVQWHQTSESVPCQWAWHSMQWWQKWNHRSRVEQAA